MDKFTIKSQEAVQHAQRLAERKGHQQIDTEHLLWSLLDEEEGVASQIIKKIGINSGLLKKDIEEALDRMPKVISATPIGQIYITPKLKEVFETAQKESERLKDEYVSVEHLLAAILSVKCPSSEILKKYGVDSAKVLGAMREIRGTQRVTDQNPEEKYQALKKFSKNLKKTKYLSNIH